MLYDKFVWKKGDVVVVKRGESEKGSNQLGVTKSDFIVPQIGSQLGLGPEGGWVERGGPGSGHWGHRGRKGKRGGSVRSGRATAPGKGVGQIDSTWSSWGTFEEGVWKGSVDYDSTYRVDVGGTAYEVKLESWWEDCLESRGEGTTSWYSVDKIYESLMVAEAGWDRADVSGYVENSRLAPFGVTYIGRKIPRLKSDFIVPQIGSQLGLGPGGDWIEKGGPGSGHWGHKGRKGKRGGSARSRGAAAPVVRRGFGQVPVSGTRTLKGARSNYGYIVEFEDGSEGIFKPSNSLETGSSESEVAYYELSKSLGWDVVPETVMYEHKGRRGSLQKWVADSETLKDKGVKESEFKPTAAASLLDAVTQNEDASARNTIVDSVGKHWSIDNGMSFGRLAVGHKPDYAAPSKSYDFRDAPTKAQQRLGKEMTKWRGSTDHRRYTSRLDKLFGDDGLTSRKFDRNLNLVIGWAAEAK